MRMSPCCCHEAGVKKGPWTEEEDRTLVEHIQRNGGHVGSWRGLPRAAGLNRCGKSCRLRWTNYLRADIKRGNFTDDEENLIIRLHAVLGNKWSTIATHLEGRTDNEIKNYWNTHIRKKLLRMGVDPVTHQQLPPADHHLDASTAALPEALLWTSVAASLGGLGSDLRQVRLLLQLLQVVVGPSNNDAISNLAAANAMLNPTASNSTWSPAANYLQLPGYPLNTSNFAEQGVVQQLANTTAPAMMSCFAAAAPVTDQHGGSAAAFASAGCQHGAAAAVDRPAVLDQFVPPTLEPMELPSLCSLESDSFWKDILEDSYLL